jgi:hypothetical protein
MPASTPKKTITVRIDAALVEEARGFVRDYAGKPLFLTMNGLVESAIVRELERCRRVLSGALPLEPGSAPADDEPLNRPVRRINNHLRNQ